jgi:hypothetical protein
LPCTRTASIPLLFIMEIFFTRYAIAVALALKPALR